MVDVEVRAAVATDYAALAQIEEHWVWRSLPSELVFPDEVGEYTVAVVEGRVWGYYSGAHDSQAWLQCQMIGQPPEDWTVSFVHTLAVHPRAQHHGLGAALLRDFFRRSAAAGSTWVMMHPAEFGGGRITPGMAALCERAGLRLVEPLPGRRRRVPSLMAAPLRPAQPYSFVPAALRAEPAARPVPARVPVAA
ncbi:hypothetical protein GCM10011374_30190 [Kocuria dechangensis]|uniref:N-acetyltransferase domain-containing protein n=1 Tax=Kocuria dechangensis TaxID=1176249 RepID=A0A917LYS0_9MICC|nr:GNAT family N-acetyltransferase [Kocuria dechangensis]GGG64521.1 hypothetical protein GCM10011374_30190 [Kocuria dechangensis]